MTICITLVKSLSGMLTLLTLYLVTFQECEWFDVTRQDTLEFREVLATDKEKNESLLEFYNDIKKEAQVYVLVTAISTCICPGAVRHRLSMIFHLNFSSLCL